MYSCYLFLFSASVRSIQFLSFIVYIFSWRVPLVSLLFLKRSLVFPIVLFSSICLHWSLRKAFLSLFAILCNSAFRWVYWNSIVRSQVIPGITCNLALNTRWSRAKANRVFSREHICHSTYPFPTTPVMTLYTDITIWSIVKTDNILSIQRQRSSIQSAKTRPEVTVAQIKRLLFQNSCLNWRK